MGAFHYDRISADMMQRMGLGKSGRYPRPVSDHWDVNDVPDFSILDWISTLQPNLRAKYIEMGSKIIERRTLTQAHAEDIRLLIRYETWKPMTTFMSWQNSI